MNNKPIHRREFLKLIGLAAVGATGACASRESMPSTPMKLTSSTTQTGQSSGASMGNQRVLRIAHLTDIHVQPEGIAQDGMVQALRHAQAQPDPPDIIINTGDSIMDSLEAKKSRTEAQWEVFNNIVKAECKLPIFHVIGNHDVWGWGIDDSHLQSDPLYGKAMAIEKLGLPDRYYSFDRGGWHFIALDSTHLPNEVSQHPYIGKIDEQQYEWLVKDIDAVPAQTSICILSHIPILAACEYFDGPNEESGNWVVPAAWMHIDARRLRQLFLGRPNIRLCLSGHTHQHEALDYLGVRYLTDGAVCGNWWNGAYLNFPPAYVMVNLYADGSSDSQFVPL